MTPTPQTEAGRLADELRSAMRSRVGNTVMIPLAIAVELHTELRRLDTSEIELQQHVCVLQGMNNESLESLRVVEAENQQLKAGLKKANDQAEHFEREWYLRSDEIEQLQGER